MASNSVVWPLRMADFDQRLFFGRAVFQHVDQGQGDLAFAQIVADVLAQGGRIAGIVQRVVNQLEGGADAPAVFGGRLNHFGGEDR